MAPLARLESVYQESVSFGMDRSMPEFSSVLRGLAQSFAPEPAGPRRISLFFSAPPDTAADGDIHGSLNALLVAGIACDFVFLSQEETSAIASERLGELALLVSSYSNCGLVRVRSNHGQHDMCQLRSLWHFWRHPPAAATLRMPHQLRDIALQTRLVPLLHQVAVAPELMTACACHNLLVARPPRCCVTGRKPTERSVVGFRFPDSSDLQFRATSDERLEAASELTAIATVAASSLDCCILLGHATHLCPVSAQGEDFLAALSAQLSVRSLAVVFKHKTRHGSFLHAALPSTSTGGPLVLVQLATQEDVLMAQPQHATIDKQPSHAALVAASASLDSLPATNSYNPLAFRNGFVSQFRTAVVAEAAAAAASVSQQPSGAPVTTAASSSSAQPVLTKKTLRLNLQ